MLRKLGIVAGGLFLSIVILFALGEVAVRLFPQAENVAVHKELPAEWEDLPRLKDIADLAARNTRGIFAGNLFETNRNGLRGPWRSLQKPPGVVRVALLGDSFTMGSGVLYENTYAARLERMLNTLHPGRKFEVINIAMAGINATISINRFETTGVLYQPDITVYGFTLDDILGPDYRHSADPKFTSANSVRDSPSHLVRMLAPRLYSFYELALAPYGSYSYELDENYLRNPQVTNLLRHDFGRLEKGMTKLGGCGVVFIHTQLWALNRMHPYLRHYDAVKQAALDTGLFAIESHRHFLARKIQNPASYWISLTDSHPNAKANAILAEALFEGLEDLPAPCWGPQGFTKRQR